MSWFGGGSKKNDNTETETAQERGYSDTFGGTGSGNNPYPSSPNMYGGSSGSLGGSSGLQEFQEFSVALQQQILVQHVITDLTEKAFSKCCTSATSNNTLTGKEAACISAVTNKWLDSNEYLVERLQRKQQQGGSNFS
jgi:hypothetical protein